MLKKVLILLAALSVLSLAATADDKPKASARGQAGHIMVEHAWARASMVNIGAAYLMVVNGGKTADRLIAATTPVAAKAQIHRHVMKGSVAQMRHVKALDIPAGKHVEFKPGGLHLMLMGLKQPLKKGQSFPLTLTFEKAGKITVRAIVLKVGSSGPAHHPGGKMDDHGAHHGQHHGEQKHHRKTH